MGSPFNPNHHDSFLIINAFHAICQGSGPKFVPLHQPSPTPSDWRKTSTRSISSIFISPYHRKRLCGKTLVKSWFIIFLSLSYTQLLTKVHLGEGWLCIRICNVMYILNIKYVNTIYTDILLYTHGPQTAEIRIQLLRNFLTQRLFEWMANCTSWRSIYFLRVAAFFRKRTETIFQERLLKNHHDSSWGCKYICCKFHGFKRHLHTICTKCPWQMIIPRFFWEEKISTRHLQPWTPEHTPNRFAQRREQTSVFGRPRVTISFMQKPHIQKSTQQKHQKKTSTKVITHTIHVWIYHKNQPNVGKYTIHGSYG